MTEREFQLRIKQERSKTLAAAAILALGAGIMASSATYYFISDEEEALPAIPYPKPRGKS